MEIVQLIPPRISLQSEYRQMLTEWKATGEDMIPFTLKMNCDDFQDFVVRLLHAREGIGIPEDFVPHSTYWLVCNKEEKFRIVGAANIRHRLNENLLQIGGHIGYGVRPSERKKGYATEILRRALLICKENLNLSKVLVTCLKENMVSAKVIMKNGGILEKEIMYAGKIVQHYWISDF